MDDKAANKEIVVASTLSPDRYGEAVEYIDGALTEYLSTAGLPTDGICVKSAERVAVARNFAPVLDLISPDARSRAFYLSKFVAAVVVGLFDAALNYLWDETIHTLRRRVAAFDLGYFYDATLDPGRRTDFTSEEDLEKLEDWELIRGCRHTGIIGDLGFRHLDYIRDMRNHASAAHPNQNQLTGLQLVAWLETCIKEVLSREPEGPVVEVRRLLHNVRNETLTEETTTPIKVAIAQLLEDLSESLLRSLFGMYCDPVVDGVIKNNIKLLARSSWDSAPLAARRESGVRYATYRANGDVARSDSAREFLELVDGLSFLPRDQLTVELAEKIKDLEMAHDGFNNFHLEPGPARAIARLVPSAPGDFPESLVGPYVKILTRGYIGNGYGVSRGAEHYYSQLIDRFQDREIAHVVALAGDADLLSRFQFASCAERYSSLCTRLRPLATARVLGVSLDWITPLTHQQLRTVARTTTYRAIRERLADFL